MKIDIKTKFSIDDTVYVVMGDTRIDKTEIGDIRLELRRNQITYHVWDKVSSCWAWKSENVCFATLEEAKAYIMNTIVVH